MVQMMAGYYDLVLDFEQISCPHIDSINRINGTKIEKKAVLHTIIRPDL